MGKKGPNLLYYSIIGMILSITVVFLMMLGIIDWEWLIIITVAFPVLVVLTFYLAICSQRKKRLHI